MRLCRVLNDKPGLGSSPSAIVPDLTRLGDPSLICRPTSKELIEYTLRWLTDDGLLKLVQSRCWTKLGITDDVEDACRAQSGARWAIKAYGTMNHVMFSYG